MQKNRLKTGALFLLYSLLVTTAFLLGLFFFQRAFLEPDMEEPAANEIYYVLDERGQVQTQKNGYSLVGPGQMLDFDKLSRPYYDRMAELMVPLAAFFCLFLLVVSLLFWLVLKRVQEKSDRQIAGRLRVLADPDSPGESDEDLEPVYTSIQERLEAHFEDYKRLNSYLSHEQKNVIARLRTRMELEDNAPYLDDLDTLTDGIDDILTLSENGEDHPVQETVDVAVICAEVCDSYRKVTDTVSFDFDEAADMTVYGKKRWITRAIGNLVDNAVKYGDGKPVEVWAESRHGAVIVTVRDRGIGISEDQQKKIFDHRYRISALNRDGYGIGLSLVSHVCDLCGGFVSVDSVPGEGSVFYLSFPQNKKVLPDRREETFSKHSVCYTASRRPDADPEKEAEGSNHMYVFTNALKNIWRNKGRNILLFFIILMMILSTVVSVVVNTATGAVINDYKAKFGAEVTIIRSNKKIEEQNVPLSNIKVPSLADYQKYGESSLLKSKEFAANAFVVMQNLKTLDQGNVAGVGVQQDGVGTGTGQSNFFTKPIATVIGSSNPAVSVEFQTGQRKIVEGKAFENKNECLVSQKFAELNNLKVGSTISFTDYSFIEKNPVSQTLTISGIYEDNAGIAGSGTGTSSENRGNEILISLNAFTGLPLYEKAANNGMLQVQVSYILNNPADADRFQQELYDKGLPTYYTVSADAASYNKAVGPVENISRIVTIFLVVVLVLGSLVLILLSTMAIRERKYEVGVLRAMGMKKAKVALGMISEMLVITVACLIIGLGIGGAVSQPIASSLLNSQVEASQSEQQKPNNTEVSAGLQSNQTAVTELDVSLSGAAVGQIVLIALLLATVSSMAGVIFITRYEPVKILSERN